MWLMPVHHSQVSLPEPDYKDLDDCLRTACKAANLQATPVFMDKAHQLYEMVLVRHGLMVVGYSFAAKTSIYRMLAAALGDLHSKKLMDENKWVVTKSSDLCSAQGQHGIHRLAMLLAHVAEQCWKDNVSM